MTPTHQLMLIWALEYPCQALLQMSQQSAVESYLKFQIFIVETMKCKIFKDIVHVKHENLHLQEYLHLIK